MVLILSVAISVLVSTAINIGLINTMIRIDDEKWKDLYDIVERSFEDVRKSIRQVWDSQKS